MPSELAEPQLNVYKMTNCSINSISGPHTPYEWISTCSRGNLHFWSVKNRWPSPHHDVRALHGSHVGGVQDYNQWNLSRMGKLRNLHGLYQFCSPDVASRHTNLHVQTISKKTDSYRCRGSYYFQEQKSSLHSFYRSHYRLSHEVCSLSSGPSNL